MAVVSASGKILQIGACSPHAVRGQSSGRSSGVCCVDMKSLQPHQGLFMLLTRPVAQARCFAEAT